MAFELYENNWSLFTNDKKEDEKHSDYNGKINVGGKLYWMNGWVKNGSRGKYLAGTIKEIVPREKNDNDPVDSRGKSLF